MGLSAGPGSPAYFHCMVWRRENSWKRKQLLTPLHTVRLTGRERPFRPNEGRAIGSRSTVISREYKCLTCGHVGWSNHADLERMAATEQGGPDG